MPTDSMPGPWAARFRMTFAAFKYRNYRLWFTGQLVSLMGSWMQGTAQGFLVFELTRSPAYLGYVAFAAGIPSWFLMLYGGVVADRVSRRNLLIATQSVMMAGAAVLATLTFLGVVEPWHILCLAVLLGVANAFDAPARQSFVLEMVEREDLTNAIALNSTMFNAATAAGPAVAGIVYALAGPAWCFAINAVSFLAVIAALVRIRPRQLDKAPPGQSARVEMLHGLRFVAREPSVRSLVLITIVLGVFGMSFLTLVPAWAVHVLGGDATTNGYLQSSRGIGALVGALWVASVGRTVHRGRLLILSLLAFPVVLLGFTFAVWEPLSLMLMAIVGGFLLITLNLCNSLLQTLSPDALRGRVMSIYALGFFGFLPIGSLLAGTLAEHLGEPAAVQILGVIVILCAAAFRWFWPRLLQEH
ncbi:MAG: MFS transporter [Deltaproteobacteria bacterium HGW-Deltaproteobacteria-17]|nr:MAG: MFS transporter [Deltaproteobacteria bacterium HGW-Deltaproteobacteria-17]